MSGLKVKLRKPRRPVKTGRPTAAQVERIDREILDLAASVFLAKGYGGASMDGIAALARMSKATLYSRYANKEALFRAVVEDRMHQWSVEAAKLNWMLGDTLEQRLRHYVANALKWAVSEDVRAFDLLLSTAPAKISRPLYQSRYNALIDLIASEIDAYTRAENKPARNARQVAFDLIVLLSGWFRIQPNLGPVSENDALKFGEHAVDILLAARSSW